jgi:GT2 family glycosyltransferase
MAVRVLEKAVRFSGHENAVHVSGHNMFVRTELAQSVKFDETLPLYGYLEDFDFVTRCRWHGMTVRNREARIVHLGAEMGRITAMQMGYSQFANPWYLRKKGVLVNKRELVGRFWARPFFKNLFRSCVLSDCRRRGLLKGNTLAIADFLRGRLDPENILTL